MGRPATKPTELRDGYYIEVRNKNQKTGIKIFRETKKQLLLAIKEYQRSKDVVVLGRLCNGKMEAIPDLQLWYDFKRGFFFYKLTGYTFEFKQYL